MMKIKNPKNLFFIVLTVAVLAYFLYKRWEKRQVQIEPGTDSNSTTKTTGTSTKINYPKPSTPPTNSVTASLPDVGGNGELKVGSKNRQVYWLQSYYNEKYAAPRGLSKITLDGIFGNETKSVVMSTVGSSGLVVSTTWNAFKKWVDDKNGKDSQNGVDFWTNVAANFNI